MPAPDRLRMVVLGDSVLWGQGLATEHKIGDRVATMLSARMNPSQQVELVANLAHSGATIGVRDDGIRDIGLAPPGHVGLVQEVNWSYPTILDQVKAFVGNGDQIGLVLLDGGINGRFCA